MSRLFLPSMDSDEHENRTAHNMFVEITLCRNRCFIGAKTYVEGGMFAVVATFCVSLHSYRAYGFSIADPPYVSPTSTLIGLAMDESAFACQNQSLGKYLETYFPLRLRLADILLPRAALHLSQGRLFVRRTRRMISYCGSSC